jgi:uncharacterized protein YbcI
VDVNNPESTDRPLTEPAGVVRSRVETALVTLFKEYYGRGPAAAKADLFDRYLVVVLEDGLTRNEQTLVEQGHEEDVRAFRLAFQQAIRDQAVAAVHEAVGRRVVDYHSQIVFHPVRAFELFVLEPAQEQEPTPG